MAEAIAAVVLWVCLLGSSEGDGNLRITIPPPPLPEATLVVAVFDNEADFKQRSGALGSVVLPVVEGDVVWQLGNLESGAYAVLAFQDLNDNRKFDLDDKGRPREPYTSSGRSGRRAPRFEASAVTVRESPVEIVLSPWRFRRR